MSVFVAHTLYLWAIEGSFTLWVDTQTFGCRPIKLTKSVGIHLLKGLHSPYLDEINGRRSVSQQHVPAMHAHTPCMHYSTK
jgi:hypothetical protein